MRFVLTPIRSNKQGVQINVGKDGAAYDAIVNTLTMHPEDMKELGAAAGATVRVRTENGETTFQCKDGNVPRGLLLHVGEFAVVVHRVGLMKPPLPRPRPSPSRWACRCRPFRRP